MRRQVAAKFHNGRLVVFIVQGKREDEPKRGKDDKRGEEEEGSEAGPVLDAALPKLGGVRLHGRVGDDLMEEDFILLIGFC